MEGNGGAKRPAFVVPPTPPPPPPPPPSLSEEDVEEQIEKFYALLENIKALRAHWRTNKRPRREEPPWQPRFVPEDFNDRNEASGNPESELHSSKDGERKKGKEKEEGREEESSLDLSLSL